MNKEEIEKLEYIGFLIEPLNFKIIKVLLEQSEGISIKELADKLNINKSLAKSRLNKFVHRWFLDVGMDCPKFENKRITKSYKLMYILKPRTKVRLNRFVDYILNVCVEEIEVKN